ncbi:hypothetical protein [Thalassotalea profundi]|uniref:Uncharacterized protein n=1 Tax=Thalassotalea profundi TaxID=2036687 RepID=A0ABQ3IDV8_9GAMM|nr:hypothetical protein [Thalassotalea profundi]GHE77187.1 hypothetical protein GCM10011501_00790 [Thalassotalea profundi]
MDVFAELLPSAHLVKSENTAKDRKQKPKHFRKIENLYRDDAEPKQEKVGVTSTTWDEKDRRSGEDRRLQKKNRGRFLDSRESKDRRQQSKGIFVKI